jgi:hypothetical protein
MKIFDVTFGETVKTRFRDVAQDAQPAWGSLSRDQVQGHLSKVVLYTLGEGPEMPFRGNFKTRHIFRRVILFGLKEIPHNIKVPRPEGVTKEQFFPAATLEEFSETIDRYLTGVEQGGLPARTHPYFGVLSAATWQRFHRLHFIHHMKQFGIAEGL